jgi:hypothetical protein
MFSTLPNQGTITFFATAIPNPRSQLYRDSHLRLRLLWLSAVGDPDLENSNSH